MSGSQSYRRSTLTWVRRRSTRAWVGSWLCGWALALSGCLQAMKPPPSVATMLRQPVGGSPSVAGHRVEDFRAQRDPRFGRRVAELTIPVGAPGLDFYGFDVVDQAARVRWSVSCRQGPATSTAERLVRVCFFESAEPGEPELELILWARPSGTYRGLALRGGSSFLRITSAVDPIESRFGMTFTVDRTPESVYELRTSEDDVPVGVVLDRGEDGPQLLGSTGNVWFAPDAREPMERLAPIALSLLVISDRRLERRAEPPAEPRRSPVTQDDAVALALLDEARAERSAWPGPKREPPPLLGPDLRDGVDRWFITTDFGAHFGFALDGSRHPDAVGFFLSVGLALFDLIEGYGTQNFATWNAPSSGPLPPGLTSQGSDHRIGVGVRLTLLRFDRLRLFAGYEAAWNDAGSPLTVFAPGTSQSTSRWSGGVAGPTAGARLQLLEWVGSKSIDLKLELLAERAWFELDETATPGFGPSQSARPGLSGRTSIQVRF